MKSLTEKIAKLEAQNLNLIQKNKILENKLTINNLTFLNIVSKSPDGILLINYQKKVLFSNHAAIQLFNRNITDFLEKPIDLDIDLQKISQDTDVEIKILDESGNFKFADVSFSKTEWNYEPCFLIIFKDITKHKKNEKILKHKSEHDHLTGLPNRSLFEKRIYEDIQINKNKQSCMAIFYIDVDNFKDVNDNFGHHKGDELLKIVSKTLTESIRKDDTVARLGGDEFAIIINHLKSPEHAEIIAKNILNNLNKVSRSLGSGICISISVGIAIYPRLGRTPAQLIRNADKAMYVAKKSGKSQYKVYSPSLLEKQN